MPDDQEKLLKLRAQIDALDDQILELLEHSGSLESGVFVAHVGMDNQVIETDLAKLKETASDKTGYLSVILARGQSREGA